MGRYINPDKDSIYMIMMTSLSTTRRASVRAVIDVFPVIKAMSKTIWACKLAEEKQRELKLNIMWESGLSSKISEESSRVLAHIGTNIISNSPTSNLLSFSSPRAVMFRSKDSLLHASNQSQLETKGVWCTDVRRSEVDWSQPNHVVNHLSLRETLYEAVAI